MPHFLTKKETKKKQEKSKYNNQREKNVELEKDCNNPCSIESTYIYMYILYHSVCECCSGPMNLVENAASAI